MVKINTNKIDIAKYISSKKGYSVTFSRKLVEDILKVFAICLKENNLVIKNLGSFYVLKKNERLGRNPKNKKIYKISKRKVISFKISKKFQERLNK